MENYSKVEFESVCDACMYTAFGFLMASAISVSRVSCSTLLFIKYVFRVHNILNFSFCTLCVLYKQINFCWIYKPWSYIIYFILYLLNKTYWIILFIYFLMIIRYCICLIVHTKILVICCKNHLSSSEDDENILIIHFGPWLHHTIPADSPGELSCWREELGRPLKNTDFICPV